VLPNNLTGLGYALTWAGEFKQAAAENVLTAQERQIAMLVRDGLLNPEVGARLFLSPAPSDSTCARSPPSSPSSQAHHRTKLSIEPSSPPTRAVSFATCYPRLTTTSTPG